MIPMIKDIRDMMLVVVVACVIVLFAMAIDLMSGIHKAKMRGEARCSEALRRSLTKFITYEGGMLIASGVDLLMHMTNLTTLFGLSAIHGVPVVTCLVGVFLLSVEFLSIREKADQKTKKEMGAAADMLTRMLSSDNFKELLKTAIEQQNNEKENG